DRFTDNSCAICMDPFEEGSFVRELHCAHVFHHQCIGEWFKENASCPICRTKVPTKMK
ncbi:hypothetical protein HELRODRAFT_128480, partial [Helobdella robusta]|uniref:RING-type domain-containing protein n=1 Tax=Helobdella robusta TaxID=6412 RepID=T1EHN1_HELRO